MAEEMDCVAHGATPQELLRSLFRAWNAQDAGRFGELFADHASYVTGEGRLLSGRPVIAQLAVGSGPAGAHLEELLAVQIGGEVATIVFRWQSKQSGRSGIATMVARRRDHAWLIEHFHNSNTA
jgi:hypothetical protein